MLFYATSSLLWWRPQDETHRSNKVILLITSVCLPSLLFLVSVQARLVPSCAWIVCSVITNSNNLRPQELLSHSTDRPERQQLKEALEAMQVCAAHYPCRVCVRVCVCSQVLQILLHHKSAALKAKAAWNISFSECGVKDGKSTLIGLVS